MNGLVMYSGRASNFFFGAHIFAAGPDGREPAIPKYLLINRLNLMKPGQRRKKLSKNICLIP
jgi:hypothetical protein